MTKIVGKLFWYMFLAVMVVLTVLYRAFAKVAGVALHLLNLILSIGFIASVMTHEDYLRKELLIIFAIELTVLAGAEVIKYILVEINAK